jgi:uncharacterized protein YdhG (YjbR/CyaY superfamily)
MNIEQYVANLPEARQKMMKQLISHIYLLFPEAGCSMEYKMPTFRTEKGWLSIGNQKNYVSLYTCSSEHLVEFKQHYPQIKTGKGCINFKDNAQLPLAALTSVITSALSEK